MSKFAFAEVGADTQNATHRGFIEWNPREGGRQELLDQIQEILEEYRDHLPLTARQIYYRLIGKFGYEKGEDLSTKVLKNLDLARRSERVPFSSIRDDGLTDEAAPGWLSKESFIATFKAAAKKFELKGSTDQPHCVELWCEAAGMVPQLVRVAHPYGVRVRSCGGFDSLSVKHEFVEQILAREQSTIVSQCGDLDASGISILDAFASDISQFVKDYEERGESGPVRDFDEPAIEFRRVLVRHEHEDEYDLIREDKPEKLNSPGAGICKATGKRYNLPLDYQIQAEAFAPDVLADVVRTAIEDAVDLDILAQTKKWGERIQRELIKQFAKGKSAR